MLVGYGCATDNRCTHSVIGWAKCPRPRTSAFCCSTLGRMCKVGLRSWRKVDEGWQRMYGVKGVLLRDTHTLPGRESQGRETAKERSTEQKQEIVNL